MISDPHNLIRAIRDAAVERGIAVIATCASPDGVEIDWDWPTEPACSSAGWSIDAGNKVLARVKALPAVPVSAAKVDRILRGET